MLMRRRTRISCELKLDIECTASVGRGYAISFFCFIIFIGSTVSDRACVGGNAWKRASFGYGVQDRQSLRVCGNVCI